MAYCAAAVALASPGRQTGRTITQSPAVGFRTMLGGHQAPAAAVTIVRSTKSMSDLQQSQAGVGRYDPSRIVAAAAAGGVRGGSPPPRASPRVGSVVGRLPEGAAVSPSSNVVATQFTPAPATPRQTTRSSLSQYAPISPGPANTQVGHGQPPSMRRTLASSSTPGSANAPATAAIWQGAVRCSSADRHYLQYASTPTSAAGASCRGRQSHATPESGPSVSHMLSARARVSPDRLPSWKNSGNAPVATGNRPSSLMRMQPHRSSSALSGSPGADAVPSQVVPTRRAASMAIPSHNALGLDVPQDEVAKLRNSLMQQIQSVQKEIQRVENQRHHAWTSRAEAPRSQEVSPVSRKSGGESSNSAMRVSAAVRIQRCWRKMRALAAQRAAAAAAAAAQMTQSSASKPREASRSRLPAKHHAAKRIQRAWKLSRWRRVFIAYSRRDLGWVGSLDWLQRHNMLYGTELAEQEDLDWWSQQQDGAPLDYEVDPWGCKKLRDHLNKMWYGYTTEELQQQEQRRQARAAARAESQEAQEKSAGQAASAASSATAQELPSAAQLQAPRNSRQSQIMLQRVSSSAAVHPAYTAASQGGLHMTGPRSLVVPASNAPVSMQAGLNRTAAGITAFSPRIEARTLHSVAAIGLQRCQSPTLVSRASRGSAVVPMLPGSGSYSATPISGQAQAPLPNVSLKAACEAPRFQAQINQARRGSLQGSPQLISAGG
eukprot:TRINITY_DN40155_c0_g1_i1.p1 TRINITY_DN40155_c0_g1~~TRINITY_DN40155_c0_g1_i1.p1  ORF type:complete len:717 (+),score=117.00 TRINITY_DN40155_c0_g1_i1:114-2264(+)